MAKRVRLTEAQQRFLAWLAGDKNDPNRPAYFFADDRTQQALRRKRLIEVRQGSFYATDAGRAAVAQGDQ